MMQFETRDFGHKRDSVAKSLENYKIGDWMKRMHEMYERKLKEKEKEVMRKKTEKEHEDIKNMQRRREKE